MAMGGLLALLDDIAVLADDVGTMVSTATKKTAGIIGDDIALNAKQVMGGSPDRESRIVWEIFKGSLVNKAILIPAFFIMSLIADGVLIVPVLMCGAIYLCYEGAEKVWHFLHPTKEDEAHRQEVVAIAHADPEQAEREKIRTAIRTDFILSAEIIAITLGTVTMTAETMAASFGSGAILGAKLAALAAVGIGTTIGVYGLVAALIKVDDFGLWLGKSPREAVRAAGHFIVEKLAPRLFRAIGVLGTVAMLVVGGEILLHGIEDFSESFAHALHGIHDALKPIPLATHVVVPAIAGLIAGAMAIPVFDRLVAPMIAEMRRRLAGIPAG